MAIDKNDNFKGITEEGELDYFTIADLEGIGIEQITNIKARYKSLHAVPNGQFKIPPISHHIWFTKPDSPKEIREQDLENLNKILTILDINQVTWQHFLWTNCKACIPRSLEKLKSQNILVREINEIKNSLVSYNFVLDLIDKKQFGIAGDFFRFDVLNNYGGFYSDLNYMLNHSPEKYMKTFDFISHTDRGGVFIDVYMIAAIPNHPILEDAVNTVLRNFINPPLYIQSAMNSSMHIQDFTGLMTYLPYNFAFFKNVNKETLDFVFPLEIRGGYPKEAKQPCFINYDFEEGSNLDHLEIINDNQKRIIQAIEEYNKNEICMESILGFDSHDGNSWFDSPPLYKD